MKLSTQRWMGKVDGKKMLHELTIPGSHQTCSYKGEPGTTKTQNRSLLGQLNRGIRFIDIRCRRTKHGFEIVHNKHSLHRHFGKDVVKVCRDFARANQDEVTGPDSRLRGLRRGRVDPGAEP